MEKIGIILQEQRKAQGFTLEDMSVKTKLSTVQLSAIEEGNISFFKDDLSYLSYFVRYYANALGVDYNEIRGELDDTIHAFTDSINVSQIKKQDEISSNIKKKAETSNKVKPAHKAKKKMDVQTIGLMALAIAIVLILMVAFFKVVIPAMNGAKDPIEPPVVVVPKIDEDKETTDTKNTEEEKPKETEKAKLSVKQVSLVDGKAVYEISGWKQDDKVTFDFTFNNASWTSFDEDNKPLANPATKVFNPGEKASVILNATEGKKLFVVMGYTNGNEISINGEKVPLDASISTIPDTTSHEFKFVGGSAQ